MQQELKEAFRLYDREGNGYITTRYGKCAVENKQSEK